MEDALPRPAAKDPVCGRDIDLRNTGHAYRHGGVFYHFCSTSCLRRFMAAPERYLTAPDEEPSTADR